VRRPAAAALLTALVTTLCFAGVGGAAPPQQPPQPDASAWLVENPATGEVLTEHDQYQQLPIASITKLMTVLVVLDRERLDDVVRVDPRAPRAGQESVGLRPGQLLTVRDLLKGALIQSANDAADALALSVAPDYGAFSYLMNQKAQQLGLTESHFVRPDGLDAPGEYSSARDVTKLALAAMRIPVVRDLVGERTDTLADGYVVHTWNDLLGMVPGVFGVKTGHTSRAGWSQVAADRVGGVTIYATILGSPSQQQRDDDLTQLLVWGLSRYRTVTAISTARTYATAKLPYGRAALGLVATKPLLEVVRLGHPLTERVVAPTIVSLPVARGQVLGRVEVWDGRRLLASRPLVASRSVPLPSVAGRLGWYATRTVHHVLGFFT
jgi:D-alanyl-D-alanine carboxypeptidase (penicillin-binding protein 5/6)